MKRAFVDDSFARHTGSKAAPRAARRLSTAKPRPRDLAQPRGYLERLARRGYSTLMKNVFRATHPADQRDSERLWPHTHILRDQHGCIEAFRIGRHTIETANASLTQESLERERQVNARTAIHLIASGPSIATIDYKALTLPRTLGVNGSIALASKMPVDFNYYCVTDTGFIRHRPELVAEIISRNLLFFVTPIGLWNILQVFPEKALRCRFFLIERVGVQALQSPIPTEEMVAKSEGDMTLFDADFGLGYSRDIRKGVFPGGTVAYESLQLAAWLGFRDIYLHGLDLSNAGTTPRFYETPENALPTQLHNQLEAEIEPSFRAASVLLRDQGVSVHNLSPISALGEDIFPKCDWRDLAPKRHSRSKRAEHAVTHSGNHHQRNLRQHKQQ